MKKKTLLANTTSIYVLEPFNNYVDKMRGGGEGVKRCTYVFVHAHGIKNVHARWGQKMAKFLST